MVLATTYTDCEFVFLAVELRPLEAVGVPKPAIRSGADFLFTNMRFGDERHVRRCVNIEAIVLARNDLGIKEGEGGLSMCEFELRLKMKYR